MRILIPLALVSFLPAADWPGFRGPNASGLSSAKNIPIEFGPSKNVLWKIPLPPGTSSPIFAADRLYLTAAESGQLLTFAIDRATGRILWRRALPQNRREELHQLNSPASATPVTDGTNVYVFFGDFGLASYGPDGEERWRLPLGPFHNFHGMGTSPILAGGKLILSCDQDVGSFLLAVDPDTGKQLWRTPREAVVHGFATPSYYKPASGPAQIIVPGSYRLDAYSADDGRELWHVRGLSWQIKTTAVIHDDILYVTGWAPGADPGQAKPIPAFEDAVKEADANKDGKLSNDELPQPWKHGGSWNVIDLDRDGALDAREWGFYRARRSASNVTMAVRLTGAKGDATDTHILWKHQRFVPQVSSPLFLGGFLYTIKDGGILTSMDARTGEIKKSARVTGALANYYASPIAASGRIYLIGEGGQASVIDPGREGQWEILAVNQLDEAGYATPAAEDGRLYIRTPTTLYCFGETSH